MSWETAGVAFEYQWFMEPILLLLSDESPNRKLACPSATEMEIMEIKDSSIEKSVRMILDAGSGLPTRVSYREYSSEMEYRFSDWRDINGLRLPFCIETVLATHPEPPYVRSVQSYEFDIGMKTEELRNPSRIFP